MGKRITTKHKLRERSSRPLLAVSLDWSEEYTMEDQNKRFLAMNVGQVHVIRWHDTYLGLLIANPERTIANFPDLIDYRGFTTKGPTI